MHRRTFLTTLTALVAARPLPVLAGPAITRHLPRATLLARTHNHCTADMLARHLQVTPRIAAKIQTLLVQRGILTTPVNGAAMATHPLNTHCVPNEALKHTNWLQKLSDAKARLQEVLDQAADPEPEPLAQDSTPPSDTAEAH
ncbi:hypothetical protein H9Q16_18270 [Sulfitobacter sp. TSTF-M16]|uniref:MarR family transcriptional regulator n=1 Tax=Sulfitobacter aestuariivivens TaxID=2766981 RepID=A0A927HFI9_9RHOB|nr:hypothetical protein [Sulfitobacter aestuariivivens]MBD3665887.1 hypothetical protein [Sulfitobacter aestuariivivens]